MTRVLEQQPQEHGVSSATREASRHEPGRMPQLDALRTFAVLGVILSHTMSFRGHVLGAYGVTLFFVLSGFLITGILLQCRDKAQGPGQSRLMILRQFYIRRFLRIFPLYYLVLAVFWICGYGPVRDSALWFFAYLTEFRMGYPGVSDSAVAHFWSLAVEEQFYMVWPWVVLWTPARILPRVIIGMVLAAPIFRALGTLAGMSNGALWGSPISALDALGFGALLAVAAQEGWIARLRRFALIAGVTATLLLIACRFWFAFGGNVLHSLGPALLSGWLVASAASGFRGVVGRIASWGPLLWVGTICYGVYVYHLPVLYLLQKSGYAIPEAALFALVTALTIALAAISWYAFERPINNLKRYFPYTAEVSKAPAN